MRTPAFLGAVRMSTARSSLNRLVRDTRGSILPMAAMSVVVIAALVGGGLDMSRAYRVQNRLQNACDAGALAGRRGVAANGFDANAQAQANNYFDVNFDQALQGTTNTSRSYTPGTNANTIIGAASTRMDMLVMKIFGRGPMTITASCSSTMGVGNSDVMMVLDTTGSMASTLGSGTRISALQQAMKNFYTTMTNATNGSNARVRYGFVPFSSTVNVGRLLYNLNPSYLSDDTTVQSRLPQFDTTVTKRYSGWTGWVNSSVSQYNSTPNGSVTLYNATAYADVYSCNSALPAATAWSNNGASTTSSGTSSPVKNGSGAYVNMTTISQPQQMTSYFCLRSNGSYKRYYYPSYRTLFTYSYSTTDTVTQTSTAQSFDHWDYRPVRFDSSIYKTFGATNVNVGSNGAALSAVWAGCIEERSTSTASAFSYSTISGMSPSTANDLDLDSAPTSNQATQWAPLWTQVAYNRGSASLATSGTAATPYCVPAAQGLQTMAQTEFNAYADSLTPLGGTYLDIGMIWGGRLSSPEGIFSSTVNLDPANGGNVARHMIFMTDGDMDTGSSIYQSYGIEYYDHRVTNDGNKATDDARHSLRLRAVCDAIKAKGIRLWVIAFTGTLNSDLMYCTSPSSSYVAADSAQLNAAFQDIAKQVGELRVLQ